MEGKRQNALLAYSNQGFLCFSFYVLPYIYRNDHTYRLHRRDRSCSHNGQATTVVSFPIFSFWFPPSPSPPSRSSLGFIPGETFDLGRKDEFWGGLAECEGKERRAFGEICFRVRFLRFSHVASSKALCPPFLSFSFPFTLLAIMMVA